MVGGMGGVRYGVISGVTGELVVVLQGEQLFRWRSGDRTGMNVPEV